MRIQQKFSETELYNYDFVNGSIEEVQVVVNQTLDLIKTNLELQKPDHELCRIMESKIHQGTLECLANTNLDCPYKRHSAGRLIRSALSTKHMMINRSY